MLFDGAHANVAKQCAASRTWFAGAPELFDARAAENVPFWTLEYATWRRGAQLDLLKIVQGMPNASWQELAKIPLNSLTVTSVRHSWQSNAPSLLEALEADPGGIDVDSRQCQGKVRELSFTHTGHHRLSRPSDEKREAQLERVLFHGSYVPVVFPSVPIVWY